MALVVDIKKHLASFDLEVAFELENETLGFLGASGCGKSMTLRCIAGIETPDEGKIIVNGVTYFDSEKKINLTVQQRKTALLFQNFQLFPNLTVEDNVAAGIDRKTPKAERDRIVAEELHRFALEGFNKRYPLQLSGGQQQRVALARMLAAKPGILMMDEPFSALDAHLKSVLEQNLVSLVDSYHGSILYVSHDIDEALRFCDKIAVVEDGHIMELSSGEELVLNPKSTAGIKLTGCKNATEAIRADEHSVRLPKWGIELHTAQPVPEGIKTLGLRASAISPAEGPGENNYRVRIDRVSDARFERMCLLGMLDRQDFGTERADEEEDMKFLHQHLFWRIRKSYNTDLSTLPQRGEELWIHIDGNELYMVTK